MSRLSELLNQYCSNGVKSYKLSDICTIQDGTHQTPKYTDSGVKFVSVENIDNLYGTTKYISEEAYRKFKIVPQKKDVLMTRIGSIGVCTVVESNEPLAFYVSLALIRPDAAIIDSYYLKHILESGIGKRELYKRTLINAVPIKVNTGDIGKVVIPVPPLEVQKEIVHILNSLDKPFKTLLRKLDAELLLRKQQYEYYRSVILKFDSSVPMIKLGDVGPVCMCKRILKSQTNTDGGVPFYKIGTFGKEPNAYISQETYDEYKQKYSFPKKGDVLISAAGTIGRTVVYDGEPAYFQDSNIVWIDNDESKLLNEFLVYCYAMKPWKIQDGGTIARLYNDSILNAMVPMPSLEQQRKIIKDLQSFDRQNYLLFGKLSSEITARQKQYEYYRDHLLSLIDIEKELA